MKKRVLTLVFALAMTTMMFGCGSKEEEITVEELQAQVEALETELAEVKENVVVEEEETEEPIGFYEAEIKDTIINSQGQHIIEIYRPDGTIHIHLVREEEEVPNGIAQKVKMAYVNYEDYSTWWVYEIIWDKVDFLTGIGDKASNHNLESTETE